MFLEFLMFWTRETLTNIRRNVLMSLLAISSVTVALFILGGFYLALSNGRALVADAAQQLDLAAILDHNIKPARRKQIYNSTHIAQVNGIRVVLKEEALEEVKRHLKIPVDDFKGANNPFSDELRIKLKHPEDAFKVRNYLKSIKGVSYVRFDAQLTQDLISVNRLLAVTGAISLFVLSLGALLIVHNTIRLTIFARRREMRIMELVGATPGFIRTPFVLEGTLYGLVGAVIAALLLSTLYSALSSALAARPETITKVLLPLSASDCLPACWIAMLVSGLGFGILGAWLSLARTRHTAL